MTGFLLGFILSVRTSWFHNMVTLPYDLIQVILGNGRNSARLFLPPFPFIIIIIIVIIDLITIFSVYLLRNLHLFRIVSGIRQARPGEGNSSCSLCFLILGIISGYSS
jgi:hypothetical protein